MLLSITVFSYLILSISGEYTDWGKNDTNRDHLPYLQGSLPGECPTGSKCRMMYLTFVVPEMSHIPPNGYNFSYGLLNCAALFFKSAKMILDGNQARFFVDINLYNNSQGILPGEVMNCFDAFLYSDSAIIYSKDFVGVQEVSYETLRTLPRYLSSYDKFQIFHETANNTRHFRALLEIDFPRNGFTFDDCCRSLLWYIGYGLIVFMEECKIICTKNYQEYGPPWGEPLNGIPFVPTEDKSSPNFEWDGRIFTQQSRNPDPRLNRSSRAVEDNVLVGDVKVNKSVTSKNDVKENGDKSSEEVTDYSTPFVFLVTLYGILVLFVIGMLIGLTLIYADKKRRMKEQNAAAGASKKDQKASIKVVNQKSKKEKIFDENNAEVVQKPEESKKEKKK